MILSLLLLFIESGAWADQPSHPQMISQTLSQIGAARALKNPQAMANMQNFIFGTVGAKLKTGHFLVPGQLADLDVSEDFFVRMENQTLRLSPKFEISGYDIESLQDSVHVHYGSGSPEAVKKSLEGKSPLESGSHHIVVSDNQMLYDNQQQPVSNQNARFKIFSDAGLQSNHQNKETPFVRGGKLDEDSFLKQMKDRFSFQLGVLSREEVEDAILVPLRGSSCGKLAARCEELMAQAYKEVLEKNSFPFKTVTFVDPAGKTSSLKAFQKAFEAGNYKGKIPVVASLGDPVELAHKLVQSNHRAGLLNPADDSSVAGMYWMNPDQVAFEESLAHRTTLLLTQHPRLNPAVLDTKRFLKVGEQTQAASVELEEPKERSSSCNSGADLSTSGMTCPGTILRVGELSKAMQRLEAFRRSGQAAKSVSSFKKQKAYLDRLLGKKFGWAPMAKTGKILEPEAPDTDVYYLGSHPVSKKDALALKKHLTSKFSDLEIRKSTHDASKWEVWVNQDEFARVK